ncbi:rhodanese-like domain-containing protein [Paradesulfitobacterium ferrireducens]|uniref:rhodanese-like domain-containing protein n=1 Tax=Paradesulfitobacterium ferrireducens TaxID=2816476 RepID=UPI001A90C3AB|nr:rhodanese-like domain-containing protein [Paradesulfitobacterium ferrireducens]
MLAKRKGLTIFLVTVLLFTLIFPAAVLADTKRIGGYDRFLTAVQAAKSGWASGADNVVLVNGYAANDAAAAGPLAYRLNAPILLTEAAAMPESTSKALKDFKAKNVYLIGGNGVISAQIEADLSKSYTVKRYGGDNVYATAASIAEAMGTADKAVVVASYADALPAASWAAANHAPILYAEKDSLPQATQAALTQAGVKSTVVLGGEAVIGAGVYAKLPRPQRIYGVDRYETAAKAAAQLMPNAESIYVATGLDFVDAMVGANLAAKNNAPLLYLDQQVPASVTDYLNSVAAKVTNISIIGGTGIVTYDQKTALMSLISGQDTNKAFTDAVAAYFKNMGSDSYKIAEATLRDELAKNPEKYLVVDIRRKDAYDKGHIPGAVNVAFGVDIANNLEKIRNAAKDKTVVVACYTGQTAGQTDSLLNLAGIKTVSLNFGMGKDGFDRGWTYLAAKDPSYRLSPEAVAMPDAPAVASPNPAIDDAVKEYFENMPADVYKIGVPQFKAALAANPEKYFILDVRQPDVYTAGHIKGAINVPFGAKIADNLAMIREKAKGKITVVYCYTGQTAGQVDSLLNILGVNAKSLDSGFGMSGFNYGWSADPTNEVVGGYTDAVAAYFNNMPKDSYKIPEKDLRDALAANPEKYVVLDIRQKDAYDKGHIPGALNVPFGAEIANNLDKIRAVAQGKTLVVACYTGQTAGQTDALLNLAGITTRSLNFGMGKDGFENGWLALNAKDPSYQLSKEAVAMPNAPAVASPNPGIDDAVRTYFLAMPKDVYKISNPDLKAALAANPEKYFVVDVRQADAYAGGHIKGAINVPFGAEIAKNLSMLKEQAKGKTMVVYCYTGQTAGQVDALMNILGLTCKSLDFGFGTATFKHGWSSDPTYEIVK